MTYANLPEEQRRNIYRKLVSRYGEERANAIINDRDPQANADLNAWRRLGQAKAGAA